MSKVDDQVKMIIRVSSKLKRELKMQAAYKDIPMRVLISEYLEDRLKEEAKNS